MVIMKRTGGWGDSRRAAKRIFGNEKKRTLGETVIAKRAGREERENGDSVKTINPSALNLLILHHHRAVFLKFHYLYFADILNNKLQ